jgi:hypothetical protein
LDDAPLPFKELLERTSVTGVRALEQLLKRDPLICVGVA